MDENAKIKAVKDFDAAIDRVCRILAKPIHRTTDKDRRFIGAVSDAVNSMEKKDELNFQWGTR